MEKKMQAVIEELNRVNITLKTMEEFLRELNQDMYNKYQFRLKQEMKHEDAYLASLTKKFDS